MHFEHSEQIWTNFPALVPGVLYAEGITTEPDVETLVAEHTATARARLGAGTAADLPEIQAWRRAFAAMGLKPTQYRCAAEALLRRLRKDGTLPRLHPLVDLCNAVSVAFAVPVAALDFDHITGDLMVRHATGQERYSTFAGIEENPEPDEVVFADSTGAAHARRWTNRQSGASAVRASTGTVLIIAEALHDTAARDVQALVATLTRQIAATWSITPTTAVLTRASARFTAPDRAAS